MANMVSYAKNISKSIKYSAIDVLKEMNPVVTGFYKNNQSIIRETYEAIKDIKGTIRDSEYGSKINQQVGGLAKDYFTNLKEDLKSGQFYNRERIEKTEDEMAAKMIGFDSDFGLDDIDDISDFGDSSSGSGSSLDFDDLDKVAEKSTNAVGEIMARTAQYQVEAQRQSTKTILDQNSVIFGKLHSSIGVVNNNVSLIAQYMKENTTAHYQNSKTYYEASTQLQQENNQILKELLELEKKRYANEENNRFKKNKKEFSDLFTDGALDLESYKELIQENMAEMSSGLTDTVKMIVEMGGLESLKASPAKFLTDSLVKTVIPNILKDSMTQLNESLAGAFTSAIVKITGLQNSDNSILQQLGKIFGFNGSLKGSIDPSQYQKGAIPFDGVTKKAIVDVIPTYLSKIYSAVSGKEERRFNYESGKYVKASDLKKEFENMMESSIRMSTFDVQNSFRNMKKSVNFKGDKEREAQFDADMKKFFQYYFKNAKLFDKKLKARDYGMTGQYSDENLAILLKMWNSLPKSQKLQFAGNIQEGRASYNRKLANIESDSMNPILSLFQDFDDEEEVASHSANSGSKQTESTSSRRGKRYKRNKNRSKKSTAKSGKISNTSVNVDENELLKISKREKKDFIQERQPDKSILDFSEEFYGTRLGKKIEKPGGVIAKIFDKVDDYLYTFIFGDDEFDKDREDNGLIAASIHKMEESFRKFDDWLRENILNPIKRRFTKQSIHDAASSFFNMFGIDLDTMVDKTREFFFGSKGKEKKGLVGGFLSDVKKDFKGVGKFIKDSFLDVFDFFGVRGTKNEKGKAKERYRTNTKNARMDFEKNMRNEKFSDGAAVIKAMKSLKGEKSKLDSRLKGLGDTESIDNAASGIKRVKKTGVIAVSEGELIIPPDLNPFNIRKRLRNENRAKKRFLDSIPNFAEGGTYEGENNKNTKGTIIGPDGKRIKPRQIKIKDQKIEEEQKKKNDELKQELIDKFSKKIRESAFDVPKYKREDYEDGETPLYMKMQEETINLINTVRKSAKYLFGDLGDKIKEGKDDNSTDEKLNEAAKDVFGNLKKYAPDMFTGGVLGGGAFLATGMIGGPLLGVAAGIGLALVKDSEKVRTWLFGEQKEGEFQGGLISKDISNKINKYFPDMSKGAIIGGITSILPFVPGGPVAGVILGSAVGFAKNNEKVRNALFGEEGLLGKDFPDKVKKTLPKMAVGAVGGFLAGPFGVATNVFLGSAIGFATETESFKNAIFGEKDKDGNRDGGLLGTIKENIVNPSIDFFQKMFDEFKQWFDKDIKSNVKKFVHPLNRYLQIFVRNIFNTTSKVITGILNKALASPLGKYVQKLTNLSHGIISKVTGFSKGVIGLPFKLMGAAGNRMTSRLIRKGEATYMSAGERVAFSETKDFKRGLRNAVTGRDYKYRKQDETLASLSDDQISDIESAMRYSRDARKTIKQDKVKVERNLKSLYTLIDKKKANQIKNYIITGNYEQAFDIIDKLPDSVVDKKGNRTVIDKAKIKDIVESNGKKYKKALNSERDIKRATNEANKFLKQYGLSNDDVTFRNVVSENKFRGGDKREKYFPGEARTFEEIVNEQQKERHQEIVKKFNEVVDAIRQISDPDYVAKSSDEAKSFSKDVRDKNNVKKKEERQKEERKETEEEEVADSEVMDGEYRKVAASVKPSPVARFLNKAGMAVGSVKSKAKNVFGHSKANNVTESDVESGEQSGALAKDLKDAKKEAKEDKNIRWDFSQGSPIKYIKSKDSNWHLDKSNSETVQTQRKLQEQRDTQKGILSSITSLPGKLFKFLGGNKEEEEQEEGFLSKMLKTAGKLAMLGALIAFAPKIVGLLKEHVLPILTDVKDGFVSGWKNTGEQFDSLPAKIGSFIGDHLHTGITYVTDFLSGSGQFEGKGFPYVLETYILPNALKGFEFLLSKVVPKAAEIIFRNLPSIIWSGVKGLAGALGGIVNKIMNPDGERKSYETDDSSGGSSPGTIDVDPGNLNYTPSSSWNVSGSSTSGTSGGGTGGSGSGLTDEERTENSKKAAGSAFNRGNKSLGETAGSALLHAAVTGRGLGGPLGAVGKTLSAVGKGTSKVSKAISFIPTPYTTIPGVIGNVTGKALNASGKVITKFGEVTDKVGNLGQKVLPTGITRTPTEKKPGIISKAKEKVGNVVNKVKETTGLGKKKPKKKGILGKATEKVKNLGSKAAKAAKNEAKGLLGKFITKVKDLIKKLFQNNKLINFVYGKFKKAGQKLSKEALEKAILELGEKLAEKATAHLGKTAGKLVGKTAAKAASIVGTGGIATILFAVTGFISGWNKADEFLNIKEPSLMMKIISGAVNAVSEAFLLGLVPIETLFDIVLSIAEKLPIFSGAVKEIREDQAALQEEVDQYNLEHGTNLTIDEYLAKDKIGTKIKNAAGKAVSGVKSFFGFGDKDDDEDEEDEKDKDEKESSTDEKSKKSDTQKVTREATEAMTYNSQDESGIETGTLTAVAEEAESSATQDVSNAISTYSVDSDTTTPIENKTEYSEEDLYTSIISTIPMYLSKIYTALTGQPDDTFQKDASYIQREANKKITLKATSSGSTVNKQSGNLLTDAAGSLLSASPLGMLGDTVSSFKNGDIKGGILNGLKTGLSVATPLGIPLMAGRFIKSFSGKFKERKEQAQANGQSGNLLTDAAGSLLSASPLGMLGSTISSFKNGDIKGGILNGLQTGLSATPLGIPLMAGKFIKSFSGKFKERKEQAQANGQYFAGDLPKDILTSSLASSPLGMLGSTISSFKNGDIKGGLLNGLQTGLSVTPLGIPLMAGKFVKSLSGKIKEKNTGATETNNPISNILMNSLASNISASQPNLTADQNPTQQLNEATKRAVNNVNSSLVSLTQNMEGSLGVIDVEHELNKKNLITANLKEYWKTKNINLGKGGNLAATLAHFITFYEKAMLFPMTLMNNALALSGSAITSGSTTSGSTNVTDSSSGVPATTGTTTNATISNSSSSGSTSSTTTTTVTGSSSSSNTLSTGSSVGRVVSKAINGVKNFASGLWTGIKGLFGKGSGMSNSNAPSSAYSSSARRNNKSSEGDLPVEEQDRIRFFGLNNNRSEAERMQKKKEYFVSQVDSPYSKKSFYIDGEYEKETVADSGCAPAAATMAINLANRIGHTKSTMTFRDSINEAIKYKAKNDGVTADYFIDQFEKYGLGTAFMSGQQPNMSDTLVDLLQSRRPVVLLGQDEENTDKKLSPFGPQSHYVVATGITDDGKYVYINDPESKKPNTLYPISSILKGVSIGLAPVPKNPKMDAKVKNSKIREYMKQYRGRALAGNSNREKVWNFLTGNGYSEAAAAGVIGNLMYESGGGPSDIKLNTVEAGSGEGIGMVQWSFERKTAFLNFLKSRGSSWPNNDVGLQCEFMLSELEGDQWIWTSYGAEYGSDAHITLSQFKQLTDVTLATKAFCANFERCHKSDANLSQRTKWAQAAYDEFKGTSGGASGSMTAVGGNVDFHKYTDLTDAQIRGIANICSSEQPNTIGWMAEASLMANLAELRKGTGAQYLESMATSGWFASGTDRFHNTSGVSDEAIQAVKTVLVEGKRTLPKYIDEHDMYNPGGTTDVDRVEGGGAIFEKPETWVPHETQVYQNASRGLTSNWTFYEFPTEDSDPFGYSDKANREKYGDGHYDVNGNPIGSTTGASGATTVSTEPAWKNPKSILDLFTIFDDLAAAYGLGGSDSSGESSTSTSTTSGGTATGTGSEQQQAIANSFIKSENVLPVYSNDDRYNFTVADDGTISGTSADCSSAVQKVYQKLIGVDPGANTYEQESNSNLYDVEKGGSGPTISKTQLGDLILYNGHVEMFTGKSDQGYTMGMGSAPGPHWDKGTEIDGKLSDWHTQNQGYVATRRWTGFKDGASTTSITTTTDTSSTTSTTDSDSTSTTDVVAGSGSGLLNRMRSRKHYNPTRNYVSGKGTGRGRRSNSRVENIIRKFSGKGTSTSLPKVSSSSTTSSTSPVYNYSRLTDGTEVYETTVNNNTVSNKVDSNSEQLIEMLRAIVKILVRIVDNSDNMKQIVSLLTQLVTVVSTTNTNGDDKEQRKRDANALKLNLLNTLNNTTSSNPDKELIDIINNMESLASL